jgi:hypothetical protein
LTVEAGALAAGCLAAGAFVAAFPTGGFAVEGLAILSRAAPESFSGAGLAGVGCCSIAALARGRGPEEGAFAGEVAVAVVTLPEVIALAGVLLRFGSGAFDVLAPR